MDEKLFYINQRFIAIFVLIAFFSSSVKAQENPFVRKLPFKEGVIEYLIRGNDNGKAVEYIKNFGKERLFYKEVKGSILNTKKESKELILITSGIKYTVDLNNKKGTKSLLLEDLLYQEFRKLPLKKRKVVVKNLHLREGVSLQNFSQKSIKDAKTILGYSCTQETIDGITQCSISHGNLILESSINLLGYHVKRFATKIEQKRVKQKLFTLPEGITFLDETNKTRSLAQKILKHLLQTPNRKLASIQTAPTPQNNLHQLLYEEMQNLALHN